MEANRRNERITRYRHPGIIPLELWDLLVNGRILWEAMQENDFHEVLCRIVLTLRRGGGETRSEGHVPEVIAGFDSLYVAGGRSQETAIRSALSGLELPVGFSQTPEHPGEKQGLHLLASYGTGWLCDLGQTSLKICAGSGRMQFQRNLERLPVRTDDPGESVQEQRRQLRGWLSESLRTFSSKPNVPEAILFAMPSRLDDAGVPEGSSYIGMAGDDSLIIDAIDAAGMAPRRVLLVNDAELAALDALAESGLQGGAKTLVITLGFGLGAALAIRRPAEGSNHA
jgi:hypothetical protein